MLIVVAQKSNIPRNPVSSMVRDVYKCDSCAQVCGGAVVGLTL